MKDILVIVTGGAYDESRLLGATSIARIFGAHVTAAIANEIPSPGVYAADPSAAMAAVASQLQEDALENGEKLRAKTVQRLGALSGSSSVVLLNEYGGNLGAAMCDLSRLSDLFVATLPTESTKAELMRSVIDDVLVNGACGVLCLPHMTVELPPAHAVVAWNGSREAARALDAALPLLKHAKRVTVVTVDQPMRRAGETRGPGDEVIARLGRHEIDAKLVRVSSEGLQTADAIIAETGRLQADLLVMGAQANGILQWFRSSVSRKVLADARLPLLMAH